MLIINKEIAHQENKNSTFLMKMLLRRGFAYTS